jgi:hypothetical protein
MSDERISDAEKLFLAVVIFLVLKGLLDPKDADDKERVRKIWDRVKHGDEEPATPSLWEKVRPW